MRLAKTLLLAAALAGPAFFLTGCLDEMAREWKAATDPTSPAASIKLKDGEYVFGDVDDLKAEAEAGAAAAKLGSAVQIAAWRQKYEAAFVAKVEHDAEGRILVSFPGAKLPPSAIVNPNANKKYNAPWLVVPNKRDGEVMVIHVVQDGNGVKIVDGGGAGYGTVRNAVATVDAAGKRVAIPAHFPFGNSSSRLGWIMRPSSEDPVLVALTEAAKARSKAAEADQGGPFGVPDVSEAFANPEKTALLYYAWTFRSAAPESKDAPKPWPRHALRRMAEEGDNFTKDKMASEFAEDWKNLHDELVRRSAAADLPRHLLVTMTGKFSDQSYDMATKRLRIDCEYPGESRSSSGTVPLAVPEVGDQDFVLPLARSLAFRNLDPGKTEKKKYGHRVAAAFPESVNVALPPEKARDLWKRTGGRVSVQLRLRFVRADFGSDMGSYRLDDSSWGQMVFRFAADLGRIPGEGVTFLPSTGAVVEVKDVAAPAQPGCELALKSGKRVACAPARATVERSGYASMGNVSFQYYVDELPKQMPTVDAADVDAVAFLGAGADSMSLHKVELAGKRFVPSDKVRVPLVDAASNAAATAWSWKVGAPLESGRYVLWSGTSFWFFTVE